MITVEDNIPLVHYVAKGLYGKIGYKFSYDDIFQVGCLGLIKAIENFDSSRGYKFSTYAVPKIKTEIYRMVRDDKWCLAKNRKERINAKPPISLDMSIGDGKNSFIDIIPYIDDSVDAKLAIDKLPHKLKSVIVLKYFYGFKQKDIADRLKISQAAVSRLEHKALNVLREEITA